MLLGEFLKCITFPLISVLLNIFNIISLQYQILLFYQKLLLFFLLEVELQDKIITLFVILTGFVIEILLILLLPSARVGLD